MSALDPFEILREDRGLSAAQRLRRLLDDHPEYVESKDELGLSLLWNAVNSADPDVLCLLLSRRADPNGSGEEYDTPLTEAVKIDQNVSFELMRLLLASGADPKRSGMEGTPMNAAAKYESVDKITLMLTMGCDVDIRNSNGETALWTSAYLSKKNVCEFLINMKADPRICDFVYLMTPLQIAQQRWSMDKSEDAGQILSMIQKYEEQRAKN